ncbi:hypothetical protein BAY61_14000 [Prauserella marina]|uniref:Uncharacterized protein n=1 Tax=Prauserella marina TaxID=530584 RepID=A0A222VPX3_9PSEU|nr:hypothetical protein [Prauserella marina]ASR35934.1 hypothetical protein BAY61_14000 [Prauserella marina]PWV84138.1 hypothetical protein DES30_101155 [Prauserella marina]SDC29499.1 hypothetical protein SAMN05421630_1011182 [Prauserella marina]
MGIPAQLGAAAIATVRPGDGKSTTARTLRLLRGWSLVLTVAVLAGSVAAFAGVRSAIDTMRGRTTPAIISSASVYEALVHANTSAVTAFALGPGQLSGAGDFYQAQIGVASQNLAQVAEHNVAGSASRRELQLVQGLLVSYTSWMSQAELRFRTGDDSMAGATDVWYAAQLLHDADGILPHLSQLRAAQLDELDDQLARDWMHPGASAIWLIPVAALAVLLCAAQVYHHRRFRRRLNPHLLAATGLLIAVAALPALTIPAQARAHHGANELREEITIWQQRAHTAAAADRRAVAVLVTGHCQPDGCGDSVAEFAASPTGSAVPRGTADDQLAGTGADVTAGFDRAALPQAVLWLIVAGAGGIAVLIITGFQRRITEYQGHPS